MTSLQEVYVSVKGLIATNLSTMGVTGYSSDDGLTTLANAILEVEGGSDLTITLDLQSSSSSIYSGQTVNLTATLTATFDGETVDLNSVLQNAPITFKEGNTTINTVSTNSNGVATISNYAPVGTGTVTLSAQFPTTDGFNGATDVITITVEDVTPVATTLTLTADKSILSYADSESATLSATVLDQFDAPMSGETVEFFNGSTSMGTATTNASGVATKSYSSTGAGDLSFTAEVGSLVSETYGIEDCLRYDDASSNKTSSYASPIVYRGSGSGQWNYNSSYGYYGTISGNNEVMIPLSELTGEDDFTIEFDALFNANYSEYVGVAGICAYENNNNYSRLSCHNLKVAQRVSINGSASELETDVLTSISRGDLLHFKFTIADNQITEEVTKGTTTIGTRTISYTPTNATKYGLALVWSNNWTKDTYLKNIKTKSL